ncbi:glycogen synthase kinase binding protein [Ictalurus furcatus]|uniref:glycogen synthase kinase binding protein n=1 Tax=Ictalurus furcatus TaxID=66913 RepID=UPI00234FC68F|nr:glycogen synthase kinase binding protein [Ictalurus furcatus]
MPCRKENYIFLEQSVTVDSKEVDALVTKIGEALQLHNNSATQQTMSRLHGLTTTTSSSSSSSNNNNNSNSSSNGKQSNNSNTASVQKRNGCCIRLRSGRKATRASPYNIPGSSDQEWDHFATWNRKGLDGTGNEDNPHQLLQELILSGNLIKEAVRRLQFSSESQRDFSKQID